MTSMSGGTLVESVRRFYDAIARRSPRLAFVNYGFVDHPDQLPANPDLFSFCRRLYETVLEPFPIAIGTVVEVGCGRGAGAELLLEDRPGLRYVGLDLSSEHLVLTRKRLAPRPFTSVIMADAGRLPLATGVADVLYSIEAAQHFEEPGRFYQEAARLVRPGGWCLLAGLWHSTQLPDAQLEATGFRILDRRDITANVVASLASTSDERQALIDSLDLPARFRPQLLNWAGVRGLPAYENLESRTTRYVQYRLRR